MKGIINFAPKNLNEFNGIKTVSFKIDNNNNWFKIGGTEEQLNNYLEIITKGSEVEFEADDRNSVKDLKVTKFVAKTESGSSRNDDKSNFEDLLDAAHEGGLQDIETELVHHDFVKKEAIVHATVTMVEPNDPDKKERTFEAYGDASMESVKGAILPHFLRMAETRAIARALRWATNNAKTAIEEATEEPDNKEESGPKDVTEEHTGIDKDGLM